MGELAASILPPPQPPTREEIREALDVFETLSRSTSSFQSVADAPLEYSMLTPAERTMSMSDDNRIVLEGLYGKLKDTGGLKLYASAQLDAGDNPSIAEMEGALGMKVTAFSPKGEGDSGGVLGLGVDTSTALGIALAIAETYYR